MKKTLLLVLLSALTVGQTARAQFPPVKMKPGNGVFRPIGRSIGTGVTRLGYDVDEVHGLVLRYLGDGVERRAVTFEPRSLWRLGLLDLSGTDVDDDQVLIDATDCSFDMFVAGGREVVRATWQNIRIQHPDVPVGSTGEVRMVARLADDQESFEIHLEADVDVPGFSLFTVGVNVPVHERGASADQVFAVPRAGGTLMPAPLDSISLFQAVTQNDFGLGAHPALLSMQWLAWYDGSDPNSAIAYFGTRDTAGQEKRFLANVDATTTPRTFEWRVDVSVPGGHVATSYSLDFPFVLSVRRGDWYDAARYYREWALQQSWAQVGSLQVNPDSSPLMLSTKSMGVWTVPECVPPTVTGGLSPCDNVPDLGGVSDWAAHVDELETYFSLDQVLGTVTVFWDENSHFNANWGEWFPIQTELTAALPSMASSGNSFGVYYAPNIYSTLGPSYTVADAGDPNTVPTFSTQPVSTFALQDPFGNVPLAGAPNASCFKNLGCGTAQDPFTVQTVRVCQQTEFFDQLGLHVIGTAVQQIGAKGAFLDNFTNGDPGTCFDVGHGHALGDTSGWMQAKLDFARRLRDYIKGVSQENGQFFSAPEPDFYLTSEGEQEMFLGLIDATRRTRVGGVTNLLPSVPFRRLAPLYQTVYHGMQLAFDGRQAISGPVDLSIHPSTLAMRFVRQQWATNVYFGHLPAAGLILDEIGSGGSIAEKASAFDPFRLLVEMQRNFFVVLQEPEVRDILLFGDRLRDPVVTGVDTVELENSATTSFPTFYPGVDDEQPLVYVNAHERDGEVGLALVNWSTVEDDTTSIPSLEPADSPGDQTVTVTIDPVEYGMTAGTYELVEVLGDGNPIAVLSTEDFSSGTPQNFVWTVPGRTMRFLVFRPM